MSNYNGPLEAVDCHIQRVRYDMAVNLGLGAGGWRPSQMASSGHLRRCSDNDTTNKNLSRETDASILSWQTIKGR
eukprot:scaffold4595_cov139-Skeletonema_dohrnii-CCMP3373.AAC.1